MREIHSDSTLQEDRRFPGRQERIVQKKFTAEQERANETGESNGNSAGKGRSKKVREAGEDQGDIGGPGKQRVIERHTFPPDYLFLEILFVLKISPVVFRLVVVSFHNSYFCFSFVPVSVFISRQARPETVGKA
jgi:hypothetical protein